MSNFVYLAIPPLIWLLFFSTPVVTLGLLKVLQLPISQSSTIYYKTHRKSSPCPPGTLDDLEENRCIISDAHLLAVYESATSGNPNAQLRMGDYHLEEKDIGQAQIWYQKAASSGDLSALTKLGLLFYAGTSDKLKGFQKIVAAAKNNYAPAQQFLGQRFLTGDEFLAPSTKRGIYWLMRARKNGSAEADKVLQTLMGLFQDSRSNNALEVYSLPFEQNNPKIKIHSSADLGRTHLLQEHTHTRQKPEDLETLSKAQWLIPKR